MPHITSYIENGIETLYQRNYFGRRLVELAGGLQAFQQASQHVRQLANGTAVLDLAADILTAAPEALKAEQAAVLKKLAPTGIFERTSGRPGEHWQPPTDAWSE